MLPVHPEEWEDRGHGLVQLGMPWSPASCSWDALTSLIGLGWGFSIPLPGSVGPHPSGSFAQAELSKQDFPPAVSSATTVSTCQTQTLDNLLLICTRICTGKGFCLSPGSTQGPLLALEAKLGQGKRGAQL